MRRLKNTPIDHVAQFLLVYARKVSVRMPAVHGLYFFGKWGRMPAVHGFVLFWQMGKQVI